MKKTIRLIALIILALFTLCGCKKEPEKDMISVTFDMNGASQIEAIKVEKGKIASIPTISREGYTFLTWLLDGYEFDLSSTIDKDITLKAIWLEEYDEDTQCVVYFDTLGGKYIEPVVVEIGDTLKNANDAEKVGYIFKYWIDDFNEKRVSFPKVIEEETYLSAYYDERKKVSIKFDTDGGNEIEGTFVYYGDTIGTLPQATKEGYLFIGWYYNGKQIDETFMPQLALTIKAKFAEIGDGYKYVTFKNDDGSVIEKQKVEMGKAAVAPTATKTGYTFKKWDKDFSFIYEDIEVNAIFDINIYKVTIKDSVYNQYDKTYDVPYLGSVTAPILEDQEGKLFAGWDKSLENITQDTIILAKWMDASSITDDGKIEHTINLLNKNYNDGNLSEINLAYSDPTVGTTVTWSTSDNKVISLLGIVNYQYVKQYCTLTAKIKSGNVEKTVSYEYVVPRITMDLSAGVCAAYVYGFPSNMNLSLETFDVFYLAFANFNSKGDVTSLGEVGSEFVRNYAETVHARGCYIVPSFRTTETFIAVATNPEAREHFADEIVRMINEYDLDGVDIDWEAPKSSEPAQIQGYVEMMKVISAKVKANNPNHLVTSAILLGAIPNFSLGTTIKYMDYVNLMTYELHTHARATHHTALYPSSKNGTIYSTSGSVESMRSYGVPYNKMIIGSGFFGRGYTASKGLGTIATYIESSYKYGTIKSNYVENQTETCKRYWDDECKVPYIYDSETGLFITYDDPEAIYWKAQYVQKKKLAGLMCWQIGQDNGDLVQAFKDNYNTLKK